MTENRTSIEDLLRHEEEPPAAAHPARSGAGWAVKTLLYAAGLGAVGVFGLRLADVGVSYLLAFTVALALLTLRRLVRLVAAPPPRVSAGRSAWSTTAATDNGGYAWSSWGGGDGLRVATDRWESKLDWSHTDATRFTRTVQPALGELVDERLRQRHGLTRASDPARARALLGEPLWALLADPVEKPPTPRQLSALVTSMEEL